MCRREPQTGKPAADDPTIEADNFSPVEPSAAYCAGLRPRPRVASLGHISDRFGLRILQGPPVRGSILSNRPFGASGAVGPAARMGAQNVFRKIGIILLGSANLFPERASSILDTRGGSHFLDKTGLHRPRIDSILRITSVSLKRLVNAASCHFFFVHSQSAWGRRGGQRCVIRSMPKT